MRYSLFTLTLLFSLNTAYAQPAYDVVAIYTGKRDQAHISFVAEAKQWFKKAGEENGFTFLATDDWQTLNDAALARTKVLIFLDTRPEAESQRKAFEKYMKNGGAWIGFHFAAFSLTPSDYPQNWDWYHKTFLGSGQYASNTWRPTSAVIQIEDSTHVITKHVSTTFTSAPNEWYRWEFDLRNNPDIKILASIHPKSFPLGKGPKQHEIWHEGYYPVIWTNKRYRMVYFNMGHNDIDYEGHTNKTLSSSFSSEAQNQLLLNSLLWLLKKAPDGVKKSE